MASEQRADMIHRIDHLNSNAMLSDLGNCESNRPSCLPLGSLLNKLLKKLQLSKFEDFIGFIQWLMNQAVSQLLSRREFWGVVQMEGFYRKKGKARRHQQSIFGADTFFLWGGRDYKGFIMQINLSLGQGQEWKGVKCNRLSPHCLPQNSRLVD